ncbi:hypothetical protein MNV49_007522 [Pseudohyphozyma bogoriensis]|nr:hypothetical protein MNV49_007522 [Pseudohyphozyma bogoriensis]
MSHTEADLKALTVVKLKDLLKDAGLAVSGKKDELISRILENENQEQSAEAEVVEGEKDEEMPAVEEVEGSAPEPAAEPVAEPAPEPVVEERSEEKAVNGSANGAKREVEEDGAGEPDVKRARVEQDEEMVVPPPAVEEVEPAVVEEEEEEPPVYDFPPEELDSSRPTDMYLDTVNRTTLDFDFEKLCSVTLSHNNIYACLTCGKYFQGRGKSSPAYAHSIAEDHHVYINLITLKVYVLPDGYEVNDPSLDDIKYLLFPTFTPSSLSKIDATLSPSYDLTHEPYYPGFVGLNNIKANSYMNAIIHSLLHVIPLRDYFILSPHVNDSSTELVKRFSMLCRKVWNPKAFKGQVSPHEFLQECSTRSAGRFKITEVGDPQEFLGWVLNTLHKDLGGNKKPKSSIIYSAFQGEVRVDDQQVLTTGEYGTKPRFDLDRDIKSTRTPFLFLTLDLPPTPVFQSVNATNIIPQVPISVVLAKYDGVTTAESQGILRRYKIERLPPFLIFHVKRFTKNNFVEEKNPTIMNFPLRGVDVKDYVDPPTDFSQYYDLVSNVTHSSAAGTAREETTWKTQVHLRPPRDANGKLLDGRNEEVEKWFQIQDLIVEEINEGMVALGESYIQIWERRTKDQKHNLVVEVPKPKPSKVA